MPTSRRAAPGPPRFCGRTPPRPLRLGCIVVARFDAVKATFWSTDNSYGVQPPLTEELVRDAERELDVQLPADLLDLLRIQNGGVVADEWNAFPTAEPTSWSADHVPFDELMGIGRTELARDFRPFVEGLTASDTFDEDDPLA